MPSVDPYFEAMGAAIRTARRAAGLTRGETARRLGMTEEGYGYWETGKRKPSPKDLHRLAVLFEVPITLFYGAASAVGKSEGFGLSPAVSQNSLVPARRGLALA